MNNDASLPVLILYIGEPLLNQGITLDFIKDFLGEKLSELVKIGNIHPAKCGMKIKIYNYYIKGKIGKSGNFQ